MRAHLAPVVLLVTTICIAAAGCSREAVADPDGPLPTDIPTPTPVYEERMVSDAIQEYREQYGIDISVACPDIEAPRTCDVWTEGGAYGEMHIVKEGSADEGWSIEWEVGPGTEG